MDNGLIKRRKSLDELAEGRGLDINKRSEEYEKKYFEKHIEMIRVSESYRGRIIDEFSYLDSVMGECICAYFTGNHKRRSGQLSSVLIDQESFSFFHKRRMLIFIIKNSFLDFDKYYKKLDRELQQLNAFRNLIVHRKAEITRKQIKRFDGETINFIEYTTKDHKAINKAKEINQELIEKEKERIKNAYFIVLELLNLIQKKSRKR
jgi:hypothetical protein